MNSSWEDKIKTQLAEEIHAVDFSKETQDRILNRVHGQIRKRRIGMKMNRKYTGVILAAALVVIGGITAIGAGKIAFTSGGHAVDEEVENLAELSEMAKEKLGGSVRIPENLAEGITFSRRKWKKLYADHLKTIRGNTGVCRHRNPDLSGHGTFWQSGSISFPSSGSKT